MKANKSILYILTSAVAFVLLVAVASATALTNSASTNAAGSAAKALPETVLTPAAPVAPPSPKPGEDIRDIRQPRHLSTHWLWAVVAAGVALSFCTWAFGRMLRHAPLLEQSPQERALERLEEARRFMHPGHAREYCFAVSQAIRGYLEEQLAWHASRLTTEEFLRELLEGQDKITGQQRALLGDFLEHCDLAKFAGWRYSLEALSDMHDTAIEFVKQASLSTTPPPVPPGVPAGPTPTATSTTGTNL